MAEFSSTVQYGEYIILGSFWYALAASGLFVFVLTTTSDQTLTWSNLPDMPQKCNKKVMIGQLSTVYKCKDAC